MFRCPTTEWRTRSKARLARARRRSSPGDVTPLVCTERVPSSSSRRNPDVFLGDPRENLGSALPGSGESIIHFPTLPLTFQFDRSCIFKSQRDTPSRGVYAFENTYSGVGQRLGCRAARPKPEQSCASFSESRTCHRVRDFIFGRATHTHARGGKNNGEPRCPRGEGG